MNRQFIRATLVALTSFSLMAPTTVYASSVKIAEVTGPDAFLVEYSKKTWRLTLCTSDLGQFNRSELQIQGWESWNTLNGIRSFKYENSDDCNGDHLLQYLYDESQTGNYNYRLKIRNKYRFWTYYYAYFSVKVVKSTSSKPRRSTSQRSIQNYNACLQANDFNRMLCDQYNPNSLWR